jgi:hypothetical protein
LNSRKDTEQTERHSKKSVHHADGSGGKLQEDLLQQNQKEARGAP